MYIQPLTANELYLLVHDTKALEHSLGVSYQAEPIEGILKEIFDGQIIHTEKDALHYYWHTFWLLIRKKDRVVVGSADFKDLPDQNGNVEIGYGLGKQFEGNGYMTEAVEAMCTWALSEQGVSHVTAETELDGIRSQHVLKRCGFKPWYTKDTAWWIRC